MPKSILLTNADKARLIEWANDNGITVLMFSKVELARRVLRDRLHRKIRKVELWLTI